MKVTLRIALISISLLCSVTVHAQEKIKLKYDFQEGRKLNYKVDIVGDVRVEVKPADGSIIPKNEAKMQGRFIYTQEIASVEKNGSLAKINVIYGQSYMNTIVNEQVIPNGDVSLLNGKIARVTVTRDGEIIDYKLDIKA